MIQDAVAAAHSERLDWSSDQFAAILRSVADGISVQDTSGRLRYANDPALELLGFASLDDLLSAPIEDVVGRFELFDENGEPLSLRDLPGRQVLRGEVAVPLTVRFRVRATGEERWSIVQANGIVGSDGRLAFVVNTFHDITARVAAERESRMQAAELRAGIARREHEQRRQAFLADASRLLSESLDEEVTVRSLAQLAVPTIADWCVIDLLDADGSLRAVAIAHVDEARVEQARQLREQYPPDPADARGTYAVVRSGRPIVASPIPRGAFEALPEPIRGALVDLHLHAYMALPLQARGHILGAITFVSAESQREFSADDLALAQDLAGRAAAAVENARLYRDVTRTHASLQRLAEAEHDRAGELNAVIGAMGDAVLVVQSDGRVTLANPAVARLFPGGPVETYADLLARLDVRDGAPGLDERGGAAEFRVRGGDDQWVEVSTWPVAGAADQLRAPVGTATAVEPSATIVLVRDITAARQRQAVRDTFLGVLSHELRTPITTIFAGAKVLARPNSLSEQARSELFRDIHDEAERLHRLVEDVIALNRFGDADDEIGREPVLLQRILPGVVAAEAVRWPGARFEARLPPGLPTVTADKTYVEQVVRNLLSNAAKYGGPDVAVDLSAESGIDEVVVRVLDNGPGFPPGEADRLFDLFFRSPTTSGAVSGAGIGLFVSARLIRAMGGRMWSALRPEGGAEFGFALKVMPDD